MAINEIDNNGKSKIISRKTGVLQSPHNGISDKASVSAPSHNKRSIVNLGHADNQQTNRVGPSGRGPSNMSNDGASDNEGKKHEAGESKSFERGEDRATITKKVTSDRNSGGKGMKGSY